VRAADILARPALVLDQRARERYFEDGFLVVPGAVPADWLARLRAVVAAKIEQSRALAASDDQFDLAPDHSAARPNIRRLRKAVDQDPELWAFASGAGVVDLVADLLGPDVRFHSSKLNFKWSEGGEAVRWHQDIQAWPHTNDAVLTYGVYLEDTDVAQGPLTAIPGTHRGPIFDQFDDEGRGPARCRRATWRPCRPRRRWTSAARPARSCCCTAAWCTAPR
jgi:ectoine hydroxylase-related dioxygenase (phytanoyl-CoA dioxygenase family)